LTPWGELAFPPFLCICCLIPSRLKKTPLMVLCRRVGATKARRGAVDAILASGHVDVIKGNEGEIRAVLGASKAQQRGVDSGPSTLSDAERARLACELAQGRSCVAVLTGAADFASDGTRTFAVRHGHEILGRVTGTGCCLGTVISAAIAASPEDKLSSTIAALLLFEGAAEVAARREDVRGPGTFVPAFIDELAACRKAAANGDMGWLGEHRVERIPVTETLARPMLDD
jgi:thiamine-phosphate diphosphorylase / hydroxyethylthiazole kinase